MKRILKESRQVVDPETGEVIDVVAVLPPEPRDREFGKYFALFGHKLLEDLGLMNGEGKLLLYFLARVVKEPLNGDGWILLDYSEAAQTLGVSQPTLYRYLARLRDRGYLEQARPRSPVWRIRPEYVYRGTLARYLQHKTNREMDDILKSLFQNEDR